MFICFLTCSTSCCPVTASRIYGMCVYIYIYMFMCVCVCVFVRMYISLYVCRHVCRSFNKKEAAYARLGATEK